VGGQSGKYRRRVVVDPLLGGGGGPRRTSSEEWGAAREVPDEQQARLNVRLADLPAAVEHAVDLSALPSAWPNMTLDERRQALLFARG
jgi:hypothetical protein